MALVSFFAHWKQKHQNAINDVRSEKESFSMCIVLKRIYDINAFFL